ncbi:hypothetical protein Hte_011120 [Hypoxylon texense]
MDISQYAASPEAVIEQTEQSIREFFQRYDGSTSREECDRLAAENLCSPVSPALVQDEMSYTVVGSSSDQPAKTELVQFWPIEINMGYCDPARLTYGDLVPGCVLESTLGFCASAWSWSVGLGHEPSAVQRDQYYREFARVSLALGEEFQPKLEEIRQGLPLLFESKYPTVIQHKKLNDATIHVDENTGRLTGVTDWADVNVVHAPFGVTLYGVEALLGIHSLDECHFHPRHAELRKCFWETLFAELGPKISQEHRRLIKIAYSYGLLVHFGVFWRDFLYLTPARRTFLKTIFLC